MAEAASAFRRAGLLPRTITAVVGGGVLFLTAWAGGMAWVAVAVLLSALAASEYAKLHPTVSDAGRMIVVIAAAALTLAGAMLKSVNGLFLLLGAAVMVLGVIPWVLVRLDPHRFMPGPVATVVLGITYLGLPHGVLARWRLERSFSELAWLFVIVWAGDIAAYFVGVAFGRHKLVPKVSPGKSWEGAVAGLLAGATAGALGGAALGLSAFGGVMLGVVTTIAAQLGDLFESAIKRRAGVKDSGGLLPGHGGVLDRFDAVFFAAPVAYATVRLLR